MKFDRNEDMEAVYKLHRDYIEHEDDLIHHRTTSMITIQSFLLATFGFTYQKKLEVVEKLHANDLDFSALGRSSVEYNGFLLVLAIVGAATSYIALRAVRAAARAISRLQDSWLAASKDNGGEAGYLPGITGGGDSSASVDGISLVTSVPKFLLGLWIVTILLLIAVLNLDFFAGR